MLLALGAEACLGIQSRVLSGSRWRGSPPPAPHAALLLPLGAAALCARLAPSVHVRLRVEAAAAIAKHAGCLWLLARLFEWPARPPPKFLRPCLGHRRAASTGQGQRHALPFACAALSCHPLACILHPPCRRYK